MFIYALPFFLTTTALIKDIFSCKAKSRPCHPERSPLGDSVSQCSTPLRGSIRACALTQNDTRGRSRTAKQCEAKPSRISGGNIILSSRRSRCCASPYGFDCRRRIRLPPLRMTRGGEHFSEGSKKHLWKSLAMSAFALLLSLVL